MKEALISKFDRGITSDPRETDSSLARVIADFDIKSRPHALTPYRSQASGNTVQEQIANMLYANSTLYGMGIGSSGSGSYLSIWSKSSLTNATWTFQTTDGSTDTVNQNLWVEYKNYIYYSARNGGLDYVRRYGNITSGPTAPGTNVATLQITNPTSITQGIVHSKDDRLYFGYGYKIAYYDNSSWSMEALTLPNNFTITCVAEYGNYLAIACKPIYPGRSRVFLWDRDSSVTTLSESIDFGEGDIAVMTELEGLLVAVLKNNSNALFARLTFRYYSGAGGAITFRELISSTSTAPELLAVQKINDRIYFLASLTLNGTLYQGLWSIFKNQEGSLAVTFDRFPNNDTALVSGVLKSFLIIGDYLFMAYVSNSVYAVTRTDDAATFTATSIYESLINPGMALGDRMLKKKLITAAVSYDPLTSGQQVVLKYKVEGGSWTTVFTESTVGTVVTEAPQAASAQFTDGREYEFRIESTGGAVITGFRYKYQPIQTLI